MVRSFVALGPAWQGTQIGSLVTTIRRAISGKGVASVFQQGKGSNFLNALFIAEGLSAHVPTTSLFTKTDEIVFPPESGALAVGPYTNIKIQDICPRHVTGHFTLVVDPVANFFMLQALKAGDGKANVKDVKPDELAQLCAQKLPRFRGVQAAVNFTKDMMVSVVATVFTGLKPEHNVSEEPPLKAYADWRLKKKGSK